MKQVQNKNLANIQMNMDRESYHGDANGVFTLSDEHADRILTTRGWTLVAPVVDPASQKAKPTGKHAKPAEPPPAVPPEVPPSDEAAGQKDEEPPPPQESTGEESEDAEEPGSASGEEPAEGPDLNALTSRKALLAVAMKYKIALTTEERALDVDGLRKVIDRALYGEG